MTLAGLPHSEIPGSKRACRSPRHIAACHVFHRLSVPRHPPSTLSNLTIKCLDLMRSAASVSFRHVVHFFIYNPYSIVKDALVAKTNAGGNRCDCFHRLSRGPRRPAWPPGVAFRSLRNSHNHKAVAAISADPYRLKTRMPARQTARASVWMRRIGGADRDRTDDPLLAKQMLSQLSYSPGDVSAD